jgi:hypothetical protein
LFVCWLVFLFLRFFAAWVISFSVGSLGGLSLSLSALSRTPSLSSLTASVRGASASAFYAISASFKPMQAGVPQNLTVLARASALNTSGASSIGGSLSVFLNNGEYLRRQATIYIVASIVSIVLKIILIESWQDASGAIWGTVIGYSVFFIFPALFIAYSTKSKST